MSKNKGICSLLYIYRMLKKALWLQIMSPCEKESSVTIKETKLF